MASINPGLSFHDQLSVILSSQAESQKGWESTKAGMRRGEQTQRSTIWDLGDQSRSESCILTCGPRPHTLRESQSVRAYATFTALCCPFRKAFRGQTERGINECVQRVNQLKRCSTDPAPGGKEQRTRRVSLLA